MRKSIVAQRCVLCIRNSARRLPVLLLVGFVLAIAQLKKGGWRARPPALADNRCGCFLPDLTRFTTLQCGETRHGAVTASRYDVSCSERRMIPLFLLVPSWCDPWIRQFGGRPARKQAYPAFTSKVSTSPRHSISPHKTKACPSISRPTDSVTQTSASVSDK